jgi:hypothetical protein
MQAAALFGTGKIIVNVETGAVYDRLSQPPCLAVWSPDGDHWAFSEGQGLRIGDAETGLGDAGFAIREDAEVASVAWRADSSAVVVDASLGDRGWFLVPVDGGTPTDLGLPADQSTVSCKPAERPVIAIASNSELVVVDLDDLSQIRVPDNGAVGSVLGGTQSVCSTNPDGLYLAAETPGLGALIVDLGSGISTTLPDGVVFRGGLRWLQTD